MAKLARWRIWTLAMMVAFATPAAAKQVNWDQSYHDSGHTGFNKQENTLSTGNVDQLQTVWGQSVDCGTVAFALDKGTLFALGQGDCNGNWSLESIDAASGSKGWDIVVGAAGNYPVVATNGKLVYSVCGFKDSGGDGYGAICAYSEKTGKRVWSYGNPCNCLPESGVQAGLVYDQGVLYFGYATGGCCANEYIVAADAGSGQILWTSSVGGNNSLGSAALAVGGGSIYFYCNSSLCAISQNNGTPLWSAAVGGGQIGLTFDNGVVYANVNTEQSSVFAFNASTGTQLWSFAYPDGWGGQDPVAVAGSTVFARNVIGNLYALHARNGKMSWSVLGGEAAGPPSVANGVVYIGGGSHDDAIRALDAATGNLLWSRDADGSTVNPPPIIANGVLYNVNDASCGNICANALPGGFKH